MFLIFSPPDHSPDQTLDGLGLAQQMQDKSQVPVIIEMLQFLPSLDLVEEAGFALQALTGEGIAGENLNGWQEWLGEHADEYPPPSRYLSWKINLLALFDPRFADLLFTAGETSRVNLVEIVWGGVRVDGIPDLNNSPSVPANEADFMNPDDRVFGVSINGEHRAYPHRILNPHEMANDLLGGEPIALAY